MCRHAYTASYKQMPRTMGERCPYPEFYEKAKSTVMSDIAPKLPVDDRGNCIFHSRNIAWKRENDFEGHYRRLLQLLADDPEVKYYDFAEFVFVGGVTAESSGRHQFSITNETFQRPTYFIAASFLDAFALDAIQFQSGSSFREAIFAGDLKVTNAHFQNVDFIGAKFQQLVLFTKVELVSYVSFAKARFTGTSKGHVVKFEDCRFDAIADFSDAIFELGNDSTVEFRRTRFEESADFKSARFHCQVIFSDVSFAGDTEFIDTSFGSIKSSARYRGSAIEFNRIEVRAGSVLRFESTDPQQKMFNHDVQFTFSETPIGLGSVDNYLRAMRMAARLIVAL